MVTVYETDKQIPFNREFIKKINLMIDRITQKNPKQDAVFQFEGGEGLGKTSFSAATGYYIAHKTGKTFSDKNMFFELKDAIDFAKNTEKQIVIFDEPAKGVLRAQWRTQLQQNLIELLMLSRKKRHFIIFNFVKFYKFNEYIVVDRCLGMAHLYERKDKRGYAFAYIPRGSLEDLYNDAIKKHQRNYFKYSIFTGEFPDVLNPDKKYNILDSFDVVKYETEKDKAISSIGEKADKPLTEEEMKRELYKKILFNAKQEEEFSIVSAAKLLGISSRTAFRYLQDYNGDIGEGVSMTKT